MKILLTGFEPFDQQAVNPSWEAVKQLPDTIEGAQLFKLSLPVVFYESANQLATAIAQLAPDLVICVGQAGGRPGISIERVAINIDDARIPDNQGQAPIDQPIQVKGPAAYFATLPIKAIYQALQLANLPAEVSNSAGTYVCNHIMYQALHLAASQYPKMKAGFVHVPYIPEQVTAMTDVPNLPLTAIIEALHVIVTTCVTYQDEADVHLAAGHLH